MSRVQGILAVTRAFGDGDFKKYGVCAQPYISKTEIRLIHKYLIVASDGLWDVFDE